MTNTASSAAADVASLTLDYLSAEALRHQDAAGWQDVLGVVGFDSTPDRAAVPSLATLTPQLDKRRPVYEVWRTAEPTRLSPLATLGKVHYRYGEEVLFGSIALAEADFLCAGVGKPQAAADALLRATESAYQQIFAVLNATGHRHLIRIWNYLPDINAMTGGEERYRHFNSARQTAFRNSGRATMGTVPAACALGSPAGGSLAIYFLAGRRAPRMIENPRQTSAYHYPPKFGRHSPIFSRACVWGESRSAHLFISGTASIVGHETIHPGDVQAQTRETMVNIGALLDEANRSAASRRYTLDGMKLKAYVRNPEDLDAVKRTLAESLDPDSVMYLQADVCREDLLVEIEATGGQGLY